jgi:hypothetical protein
VAFEHFSWVKVHETERVRQIVTTNMGARSEFLKESKTDFNFDKIEYRVPIQGDFESCADILITSYWLHVELGKNV